MKTLQFFLISLLMIPMLAWANGVEPVANLDELLSKIKSHQTQEKALYKERELRFRKHRDQQKKLLDDARQSFLEAQTKNNPLQKQSDENAEKIAWMRQELNENIAEMGDIYTTYNEFSGDFIARMNSSLVSAQLGDRAQTLEQISSTEQLPDIDEMRQLWVLLLEEMAEAGKSRSFAAEVIAQNGEQKSRDVYRVGVFTLLSEGELLRYLPDTQEIVSVPRQSLDMQLAAASLFNHEAAEMVTSIVDPTRGSLLGLLGQSPSLYERLMQGKEVGFVIIALGLIGLLVALYRMVYLAWVHLAMGKQLKNIVNAKPNNPLGRVLAQAQHYQHANDDVLQSKLDEAILKELPHLEKGQGMIKLLAAIAPLLGLLGTVIGMIATFQSISLFGSGDPKLMASGISQALVTTVLGLVVAIPLLFFHNVVSSFSRALVQILDEQSAGIIAGHLEAQVEAQEKPNGAVE